MDDRAGHGLDMGEVDDGWKCRGCGSNVEGLFNRGLRRRSLGPL